jgi:hypothetical protein
MAALQADNVADLLVTTLRNLGKFKWTDAAARLQRYVAFTELMRKHRVGFSDGYGVQWQVQVAQTNGARMTGLYGVDNVNQGDLMKSAYLPFRHLTNNFAYDRRELQMNGGASRILDLIKVRRYDCWLGVAEKLETQFWSAPSSGDDNCHGVPYHIVKNASTGFNGGHASGHSDWAGLSRTTYDKLKNFTGAYSAISKDDLVATWSRAADECFFMPPVEQPSYSTGREYGYYTARAVRQGFKTLIEAQNDNLGDDLDSKHGRVMFRRTPVEWVPKLDSDTDAPLYGINWGVLRPVFLQGEYMREDGPTKKDGQHTTYVFHVDLSFNIQCTDPRSCFVLSNGVSGTVSA